MGKAGRPRVTTDFRQRCRDIVLSDGVWSKIRERCESDPEFAVRIAEHGFGRPPQSIDVNQTSTISVVILKAVEQLDQDQKLAFAETGEWPKSLPAA